MKKLFTLLFTVVVCYEMAFGQQRPTSIITGTLVHKSPKISDIPVPEKPKAKETDGREFGENDKANKKARFSINNPSAKSGDASVQSTAAKPGGINPVLPLITTFDGVVSADNVTLYGSTFAPPDPVMSVGPNHVVMMANSAHKIYNKAGTLLTGPLKFSAIAPGAGDDGDPIALYDQVADRWLLLQFDLPAGNEALIFCISQTSDPTGAYNVYRFPTPGVFPDYPHIGIWNNSYIITTHEFNQAGNAYLGQGYYAVDRNKMVDGTPTTTLIRFQDTAEGGYLPVSFEGSKTPESSSQPLFITFDADELGGADQLKLRTLTPNFVTPESSTLSAATLLPTSAFDGRSPVARSAIEQSGTADGLDAIADRMMSRIIYRRFDNSESLVMNYAVNVSGVNPTNAATYQAAMRWYELSRPTPASPWIINQQSTYAPTGTGNGATGDNRWMGCTGIDQRGNIAMGYSKSSSTTFPSIYYAERKKSDALNTLSADQLFHASTGSQTGSSNRWGDYTAMATDPSDEETLWYTDEYYSATGAFNFKTRIGSFKINDPLTTAAVHFRLGGTIARQKEVLESFKDYPIFLDIDNAPSQNVNITLTKTGTATEGVDYNLLNTSGIVLNGASLSKQFTLRVYDNALNEPDEFIDIAYTLNFNGGNGVAGIYNQKHRVTIIGIRNCPSSPVITVTRPTAFCQGDSAILDVPVIAGITYQWLKGGVNIVGATQPQLIVKIAGVYTVATTKDSCTIPSGTDVTIVVNSVIVPTVGTYNVCQNASVPLGEGLVVPGATNTVSGSLVSGTTYVRGSGDNTTTYTANKSVFFQTYTFVAPSSSAVTFATTAAALTPENADDTYLTLYQSSFTPATPAVNFLRGDDDNGVGFLSSLTHTLTAGNVYVLVVASFLTGATGTFTLQASAAISADALGFGGTDSWFVAKSGGSSIFTGNIFNPIGVAGSGITNTATPGAFNFYVSNSIFPTCRALTTFNIVSNTVPTVGIITQPSCITPTGSVVLSGLPSTGTWTINPGGITGTGVSTTITGLVAGSTSNFTVTSATCVSAPTANVVINAVPSPPTGILVGSNSPITEGSPINLTSSSTGGTSQSWAGSNAFSSTAQNPTITSATLAMAGVYTVTITSPGTCTAMGTINVMVMPTNTVVFVNITNAAAPTQNGISWATAFGNLQTALATAPANAEIWIAQGTYKPTTTTNQNISFNIPSGAMLFGGFVGTEVTQNQRDYMVNSTILSGEIGSVATVSDNSYHVITFIGASNSTILDGFTIMAGNANFTAERVRPVPPPLGQPLSTNDGGGIGLDNASSPMIINCKIISNDGINGGGLFATNGSNPTIMNSIFRNNQATFGGAIYHLGSNPVYKNVLISGNKATGGAMYNNGSNPMITNATIAGNGGFNGAVFNSSSTPIIKNSILWGNVTPSNDVQSIISYSIVEGGYLGVGNLNLNPQFVNLFPYGLAPTLSGDYRLTNTSPAIDLGDNGTIGLTDKDLIGNPRVFNGGLVDIGAYEFQGSRIGGIVISITSGNWETGSTWNIGRKPLAGDMVIINNNHIITVNENGVLKNIELKTNAKVMYSTAGVKLQTGF